MNDMVTRAPWTWRLLRGPMTRFFDRAAPTWDERYASDPARLAPLTAALDLLPTHPPACSTSAPAPARPRRSPERWPGAEVTGIDISPAMIEMATRAHPGVRFLVADVATSTRARATTS